MLNFGTVKPGTTLYIPFATYDSNDPTASVTMTGLAVTDIEIYKNGSTTQRASDSGYTLLDTDGIDFDGLTGIHGFSIDLADNTTAAFYEAGAQYWVVVSSVTVDGGTVSFIAATFRIGMPDAVLDTSIATLASQTSFTLTAGPADDNALVGCVCYIHDVASAVQGGFGVVTAYTGSTRTVTLAAGVSFTAAATDNISFFRPVNTTHIAGTAQTANDVGADADTILTRLISLALTTGSVAADGSNSATSFKTDLSSSVTDFWKDALLLLTSGALAGQVKKITAYNGSAKFITVEGGFTATPADDVTFVLINR